MDLFLQKLSIMLVPGLLAITMHEVAHGWVAERFGDPTARLLGRLTLNPLNTLTQLAPCCCFSSVLAGPDRYRSIRAT